ncbi:polyketide-8 synthase acyl carrier protein [Actinophytocola xinjiangensis]|uniref:Polyketide-8 synthase acyl carrier protein n=1 Tax=Actinophytocola xinjiangensis TaxID=485602 RepID=A0A7Z1AV72_9PSEU|nr:acyl carrier protein [Actinophytocola xinjiangensis]OLF04939.1 polyketide-8 synthase acyl carrier protein [Actinophytocola xinjiangensis]
MNARVAERAGEIKAVVCRVLEVDEAAVSPSDNFVQVHGADSMKLIELLANLEIEFDVDVDSAEFDRMVDLNGVYDVLSTALEG